MSIMRLTIRSKNTHVALFTLHVAKHARVCNLQRAIWHLDSTLQPERQRLFWKGRPLLRERVLLSQLGVRHGDTLLLHFWHAGAAKGHYWNGKHLVLPSEHDWFATECLYAASKCGLLRHARVRHSVSMAQVGTDDGVLKATHPGLWHLCFKRPRGSYNATEVQQMAKVLLLLKSVLFARLANTPKSYKATLARTLYRLITRAAKHHQALS